MDFNKETLSYNKESYFYFIIKGIAILLLFMILHQVYKASPEILKPLAVLVSGTNEALFQHFKMGFVIWFIILLIELIYFRQKISNKNDFIFSRMIMIFFISWIMFTVWNVLPIILQTFEPAIEVEIIWSFVATFLTGFLAAMIEHSFIKLNLPREVKIVIIVLSALLFVQMIVFSFNLPPDWVFFHGPESTGH